MEEENGFVFPVVGLPFTATPFGVGCFLCPASLGGRIDKLVVTGVCLHMHMRRNHPELIADLPSPRTWKKWAETLSAARGACAVRVSASSNPATLLKSYTRSPPLMRLVNRYFANFQPVLESVEAVFTTDANGTVLDCNSNCEMLFGYGAEELRGKSLLMFFPSTLADIPFLNPRRRLHTATQSRGTKVQEARHKDGSTFKANIMVSEFEDDGEKRLRAIITRYFKAATKDDDVHKGDIVGAYEIVGDIGEGYFGVVKRARHRFTNHLVAVKTLRQLGIQRQYEELSMLYPPREVALAARLKHPNIAALFDIIYGHDRVYLISEFFPEGDLFTLLEKMDRLPEPLMRKFMRQLLSAVDYMHCCGIVHRDLKPENFLLTSDGNIKVIDLGLGNYYDGEHLLNTFCGSLDYAAPELWLGKKYEGWGVDVWSLGVVLYLALTGYMPFVDSSHILRAKYIWPKQTPAVSADARDLVSRMLVRNPKKRATLKELMSHPWVTKEHADPVPLYPAELPIIPVDEEIIEQMKEYGFHRHKILESLNAHDHNQFSTAYFLLFKDKYPHLADLESGCPLPLPLEGSGTTENAEHKKHKKLKEGDKLCRVG